MEREHIYQIGLSWTGNQGEGTIGYRGYERTYTFVADGKPLLHGSADPAFRGDPAKYNPEDLLIASLSACHMLTYLHLCVVNGIVVTDYHDQAKGTMVEVGKLGGRFKEVILHPVVTVKDASMIEKANSLHHEANKECFIAASCNFPVSHQASCRTQV